MELKRNKVQDKYMPCVAQNKYEKRMYQQELIKYAELNLPIPEASLRGIYGKFSCGPSCFDSNNRGKPRGI